MWRALVVGLLALAAASSLGSPPAEAHRCRAGLQHVVIGAHHACLGLGQRCLKRHDRTYHRLGFHCHGRRLIAGGSLSFPVRAAFYYPWFPETWTVRGRHVAYRPLLGYYNSSDAVVARSHVRQLQYGRFEAAIASWWGRGTHAEGQRVRLLLDTSASLRAALKWSIYYEPEGQTNPSVAAIRADLAYLAANYARHVSYARVGGKPVIFVYNAGDVSCEVADRWRQAAAGAWYVVLKVFPGFASCPSQPNAWHQYAPANAVQSHLPHSFNISPGFWLASDASPRLGRDPARWAQNVRSMAASGARWQLVTSFNEWGEGTAVESARDWASASGRGAYLDALRAVPAP
jgi:hypothetical protein